jgi:ATP-dependent Lon protease
MYRIQTKGYSTDDKLIIARDYLIPSIEENIGFKKGDIVLSDDVIKSVIKNYADEEQGVRNLKRCIEIIYTKLNLCRLTGTHNEYINIEEDNVKTVSGTEKSSKPFTLPFTVKEHMISELIKRNKDTHSYKHMYM